VCAWEHIVREMWHVYGLDGSGLNGTEVNNG
jgi:hypothetical protein